MKHRKRPTVKQMKIITRVGLNAENWLVSKDTVDEIVIVHRVSGKPRAIPKSITGGR